jgi:hypothetical protein
MQPSQAALQPLPPTSFTLLVVLSSAAAAASVVGVVCSAVGVLEARSLVLPAFKTLWRHTDDVNAATGRRNDIEDTDLATRPLITAAMDVKTRVSARLAVPRPHSEAWLCWATLVLLLWSGQVPSPSVAWYRWCQM